MPVGPGVSFAKEEELAISISHAKYEELFNYASDQLADEPHSEYWEGYLAALDDLIEK